MNGVCEEGLSFTESVHRTYSRGLFEDDAFIDLEGLEAAEKVLVLCRELGFNMSMVSHEYVK